MNVSQHHTLYPLFKLAQQDPDRQILSFVDDQGRDSETRTAAEFVNRITRLAAYLQDGCGLRKGDVALLIYPPSMQFVEAFAACLACGIVAAPVYPPNLAHSENDLVRLRAIAQQSGAKAMLTNRSYRWAVRLEAAKGLLGEACQWPALPWYVTQGLNWYHASETVSKVGKSIVASETTPLRATFPETEPAIEEKNELALLQFTSGSTGVSTGDLGFLHANELFITGRKKDLIILNGRNFQPEDLEEAIRHIHPKIRAGGVAAFSVPGNATEKLVVIAEVLDSSPAVRQEIIAIIRKKISEIWKVQATIGLLAPKSLKKTTSGKIQRAACRQAWLEKKFSLLEIRDVQTRVVQVDADSPPMAQQLDEIKIEDRVEVLVDVIKKMLRTRSSENTADIGIDDFLPDSGMDSLGSTELLHALEGMLHHPLPATLFIEHPTLRSAATRVLLELGIEHLAGEANVSAPEGLPFRPPHRGMAPGRTRIAIIGGGVGGLVSALELVRLGFRDIVLFEESDQCGGKVKTVREENELIELGANFFGDTCQNILGLAREMKCEIVPNDTLLKLWDEKHGLADAPARSPCKKWAQSVIRASRQPVQSPHPFPSMTEGLDQPFNAFLKEKNLYPIHPLFQFDWNAMGYGLDDEELSSYVIPYLQVAGSVSNTCFMKNGNQELWTRLAEYLEKTWGVTFRYRCKISRATPDAEGVTLYTDQEEERFDEVILAIPPDGIEKILPENDPLQEIVTQFEYYGYTIQSFKAEDLKGNSVFTAGSRQGILFPEFSVMQGKPILIGPCHRHEGWFISGHISAVSSRKTSPMNAEELADELAQTLKKMNVKVDSWGPSHSWNYFPHLRKNASQVLRKAEALQGTRHIWTTGSWISFETTEHVARHAQHLIQTCFEPSWNGKMAKTILLY